MCHFFHISGFTIYTVITGVDRGTTKKRASIEGEIGEIGTGSEIHEEAPQGLTLTATEEAREFAAATGIDILAPAVGNTHGLSRSMIRGEAQKRLDIDRIAEIRKATGLFITLHDASGTDDDDLWRAIRAGITEIHINTEVRLAWRRGLETAFGKERDLVGVSFQNCGGTERTVSNRLHVLRCDDRRTACCRSIIHICPPT